MDSLKGQVVFITGGGNGIGKAIAREFAKRGATLIIADIKEDFIKGTVAEIEKLNTPVLGVVADVTD